MEKKLSSSSLDDMIQFDENKNCPELNTTITFETSASKLHINEETFNSCPNEVFNDSLLNKTMILTSNSLFQPSISAMETLTCPNGKLPNVSVQSSDENHDKKLMLENENYFGNGSQSSLEINSGILGFSPQFNQKDLVQTNEEFHDAVQFFNDSTAFEYLKNAGNSSMPDQSANTRLSLFRNFDPLHSVQNDEQTSHLSTLNEVETDPSSDNKSFASVELNQDTKEIVNKHISKVSNDSSNILISFDSPVKKNVPSADPNTPSNILISFDSPLKKIEQDLFDNSNIVQEESTEINKKISFDTTVLIEKSEEKIIAENNQVVDENLPLVSLETSIKKENLTISNEPLSEPKLYTEEELQDALKIQKLDYENKLLKFEEENKNLSKLNKTWRIVLTEFCQVFNANEDKTKFLESTIEKLKQDLKQAAEDQQNVEEAFANLHKRYEQVKSMLKTFKENENALREELENKKAKLLEDEKLFEVLKSRAQSELDKATEEMVTFKKSSEAQIAVLQAQLRKAELKITSLESDIIQVKKENSQLGGICDDLISKVGKS